MEDPGSESARTAVEIQHRFANAGPVRLRRARHRPPRQRRRRRTSAPRGSRSPSTWRPSRASSAASSYWVGNLGPLKSDDGKQALVFGSVRGGLDDKVEVAKQLSAKYTTTNAVLTTAVTGRAEIARQISQQAEHDLKRSELLDRAVHLHRARRRVRRRGRGAPPAQRRGARGGRDPADPDVPRRRSPRSRSSR